VVVLQVFVVDELDDELVVLWPSPADTTSPLKPQVLLEEVVVGQSEPVRATVMKKCRSPPMEK